MMKQRCETWWIARAMRGFTLMEAMIAITILLVIILFTSKIFTAVSDVTAGGQANADVMQETAAIEQQLRQDFERLSSDGFMVIQCRAVRNAINDSTNSNPDLWLDPNRGPDDYIRSDQILFFSQGVANTQVFAGGAEDKRKPQSTEARIYWGHGFQLGDFADQDASTNNEDVAMGFPWTGFELDLPPWYRGRLDMVGRTEQNFFQPRANQWTLARQAILLAHDGGLRTTWGKGAAPGPPQGISAEYLWDAPGSFGFDNLIRNSRVDAAASRLGEIRQYIYRDPSSGTVRKWGTPPFFLPDDMPAAMIALCKYPRAERKSPTMFRADHATSVSTLGSAVSDFIVEWTYDQGMATTGESTGFVFNPLNTGPQAYLGVEVAGAGGQPWFGLPDDGGAGLAQGILEERNVWMLTDDDELPGWAANPGWQVDPNGPVFPEQFETTRNFGQDVYEYTVVFAYNQSHPLNDNTTSANFGLPWSNTDLNDTNRRGNMAYTPWPSSLRVTMRVHDVKSTLAQGRKVQFIVNLPKRTE